MINRRNFLTTVALGTASAGVPGACGRIRHHQDKPAPRRTRSPSTTRGGATMTAPSAPARPLPCLSRRTPDIKVNGNFTDFAGYWQKRATEAAGGGLPDVMQWDLSYLRDYGQRNQLLDLGTVKINTGRLREVPAALGPDPGKTYGIPTSTNAFAVYYDPAKLASLGIAEPDGSWTYKEFNILHHRGGQQEQRRPLRQHRLHRCLVDVQHLAAPEQHRGLHRRRQARLHQGRPEEVVEPHR